MITNRYSGIILAILIVGGGLASFTSPAAASCFENLGQTGCPDRENFPKSDLRQLSCQNLWLVRNSIYDENGYCFKTPKAREMFDNNDCSVSDASAVKLNNYERSNIERIKQVEREMNCN